MLVLPVTVGTQPAPARLAPIKARKIFSFIGAMQSHPPAPSSLYSWFRAERRAPALREREEFGPRRAGALRSARNKLNGYVPWLEFECILILPPERGHS